MKEKKVKTMLMDLTNFIMYLKCKKLQDVTFKKINFPMKISLINKMQ